MRVPNISRLSLTLMLLAAACVALAGNLGPDDQQVSFTGPANTPATDAVSPAVAFAPASERYLLVWSADENDGDFLIMGQLLTGAAGIPVGPTFQISTPGVAASDHRQPAVAHDPTRDRFLVVWSSDATDAGAYEVLAQAVSADGVLIGANQRLSDMGATDTDVAFDAVTPDVVWHDFIDSYVVVWAGDDDTGLLSDGRFELYGQLVSGAGFAEVGANDFRISYAGPDSNSNDAMRPALAVLPNADRWFVAFEGDIYDDGIHDPEVFIYGGTGDLPDIGAPLVSNMGTGISNDGLSGRNPDLTYVPSSGELVCVWDGSNGGGQERQIYGARIQTNGTVISTNLQLSMSTSPVSGPLREAIWPAIAVDPVTDEMFVAWQGAPYHGLPQFDHEVWAARFDDNLNPVTPTAVALSDMDPVLDPIAGAGRPVLAVNSGFGAKLVAWSGDLYTTPGGEHEIFTQAWTDDNVTPVTDLPAGARFALHGAAPNPFNPMTTIAFDLPRSANATLRVYDAAGRLVRTLMHDTAAVAGRNEVVWNGLDNQGRRAASGVYLYRLEAGEHDAQGRMTLVK